MATYTIGLNFELVLKLQSINQIYYLYFQVSYLKSALKGSALSSIAGIPLINYIAWLYMQLAFTKNRFGRKNYQLKYS